MEAILVLAQSGGEAARSGWDAAQTALLPALIVTMIGLFLYMFKGLRSDVQKLSERIDAQGAHIEARFAEARRLQDDSNLRISAIEGRVARIEGFFEILLAGRFKSVGANAAAGDAPPTESSEAASEGEAGAVESSAEKVATAEEATSEEDSAEDGETTPSESELDPLPNPA